MITRAVTGESAEPGVRLPAASGLVHLDARPVNFRHEAKRECLRPACPNDFTKPVSIHSRVTDDARANALANRRTNGFVLEAASQDGALIGLMPAMCNRKSRAPKGISCAS